MLTGGFHVTARNIQTPLPHKHTHTYVLTHSYPRHYVIAGPNNCQYISEVFAVFITCSCQINLPTDRKTNTVN